MLYLLVHQTIHIYHAGHLKYAEEDTIYNFIKGLNTYGQSEFVEVHHSTWQLGWFLQTVSWILVLVGDQFLKNAESSKTKEKARFLAEMER